MNLFRPANLARFRWNYSKTLFQTAIFWLIFLWAIPALLLQLQNYLALATIRPMPWLSIALFLLGSTLGLRSGFVMSKLGNGTPLPTDCPRELVIQGPYAFVRNPMAIAGIGQGIAIGLWLGSPLVIAYAFMGAPAWHLFVRPFEESDLAHRFGETYDDYRNQVRLWLPRLTPYGSKTVDE